MLSTLRVIDEVSSNVNYWVKAELVKDYHATDESENVAWNGTLQLFKDSKGNYYLEYHSGNSAHKSFAKKVPKSLLKASMEEAKEYIL